MQKRSFYLLLLMMLLSGCATAGNYQQTIDQWRGKNVQNLQRAWGKPDMTARLPNGNILYVYRREQLYTMPPTPVTNSSMISNFVQVDGKTTYVTGNSMAMPGQTITRYCRTWFEVNTKNIIVSAQAQGTDCVAGLFS